MEEIRLKNDETSIKLRRSEKTLSLSGVGVLMFAVWSILKTLMTFTLNHKFIEQTVDELSSMEDWGIILSWVTMMVVSVLGMLFDLVSRYYIFKAANAEAKGKKKGVFYLILSAVIMFVYLLIIAFESFAARLNLESEGLFDTFAAMFFSVASLVVTADLFVAGIRVKVLRKKQAKEV